MKVNATKKEKSTMELNVIVPKEKVKEEYDLLFDNLVKSVEIKGFRKGQAPAELVKEKTDVSKLYGDVINSLLQKYYPQALKENKIMPVANPRVEINEFDLDKDFEFTATIAVRPEVKIGDYKKEIKKILDDKNKELSKLNAEKLKKGETLEHDHAHVSPDDVIDGILEVTELELADLLIEDETDRLMSRLIDQAQSIGMSLDQYLKAHNKSVEDLKKDYNKIAERNLLAEFALSELIQKEEVKISDEEVDEMIKATGNPEAMANLDSVENRLYVRSILLKNKFLTDTIKEIEGDLHKEHENNAKDSSSDKKEKDKKSE